MGPHGSYGLEGGYPLKNLAYQHLFPKRIEQQGSKGGMGNVWALGAATAWNGGTP